MLITAKDDPAKSASEERGGSRPTSPSCGSYCRKGKIIVGASPCPTVGSYAVIKVVSEQSEREIAIKRAGSKLNWAIKDLAANILRIIAGAGESSKLIDQIRPVIAAYENLLNLTEYPHTAESQIEQTLRS